MSELGKFLERFYGPDETFHTVHALVRHTKKSVPKDSSPGRGPVIGRRRRGTKQRKESEDSLVFWGRLPGQVRVETKRIKDGQTETSIEVVNGEDAWMRHGDGNVELGPRNRSRSREEISFPTEFQRHFDRGLLRQCFAALTLEENGTCQIAGRDCLKIHAIQIPRAQLWPHWLSFEASKFEFAADMERAVLLSIVAKVDNVAVETHEVFEVTFDEDIDDSLFVYEPEADETVQAAIPVAEHSTLETATARAPFVVLKPMYLPESERVQSEAMYHPARPANKEEHLTVFYRGAKSYDSLWITLRSKPDKKQQEELEWDELVVGGRQLKISDPHPEEGLRVLLYVQDGTHVEIVSDLSRDEMVRIALSLKPV